MKRFQQNIRKVVPYVPGDQPDFPDMIKLNTNESPYPPAPEVQEVLAKYGGEYTVSCRDKWFRFTCSLPAVCDVSTGRL